MKIIATSDWHLGNIFHGNDRLPEHIHFLDWLNTQIREHQPDALLVAGDVFDNGNPSAAAQSAYYAFLAEATARCPHIRIVITAGNHDSASRLEAPRELLSRHNVEIRGSLHREWVSDETDGHWEIDYDDLMIPVKDQEGNEIVVLAVPFLRSDIVRNANYSQGVNRILKELTERARGKFPGLPLVMMAHIYAKGAEIAHQEASEKIAIGGQEEVNMEGWADHPEYLTCGHIHKRQHVWNTDWARYTGSVLPMSFAEKDYRHGVDLITFEGNRPRVELLEYQPQHRLRVFPENDEDYTINKLKKLLDGELADRVEGRLSGNFEYLVLRVQQDRINNDAVKDLESFIETKDAVLCKMQKISTQIDIHTLTDHQQLRSVDDILNRDPMEALKECFLIRQQKELNPNQLQILEEIINNVKVNS